MRRGYAYVTKNRAVNRMIFSLSLSLIRSDQPCHIRSNIRKKRKELKNYFYQHDAIVSRNKAKKGNMIETSAVFVVSQNRFYVCSFHESK